MKNIFPLFVILVLTASCNPPLEKFTPIKKQIGSLYKAKISKDGYIKDSLIHKHEMGYDSAQNQKYFLGHFGYGNTDTSFTENNLKSNKVDSVTYFYDPQNKDTVLFYILQSGDTSFEYDMIGGKPYLSGYTVYDENFNVLSAYKKLFKYEEHYLNRRYDKYGNLLYALVERRSEGNTTFYILENEYEYYK